MPKGLELNLATFNILHQFCISELALITEQSASLLSDCDPEGLEKLQIFDCFYGELRYYRVLIRVTDNLIVETTEVLECSALSNFIRELDI